MKGTMPIALFIRKIVLDNDKIEICFNTPLRNGPDDDRGCSFLLESDACREFRYTRSRH